MVLIWVLTLQSLVYSKTRTAGVHILHSCGVILYDIHVVDKEKKLMCYSGIILETSVHKKSGFSKTIACTAHIGAKAKLAFEDLPCGTESAMCVLGPLP
jgi:hypothetical protein